MFMCIMKSQLKILLVEDDVSLGRLLLSLLESRGYTAELATDGKQGFQLFNKKHFDFCILDVVMPVMDGFELAAEIREIDKNVPLMFLTTSILKKDKIKAFSIGADDYVTKPFTIDELVARMEAIMRRAGMADSGSDDDNIVYIGKMPYNYISRELTVDGKIVKLTTKEGQLLHLLYKNKGGILDRLAALRAVWGDDNYYNSRSMDVYIAKLRKILKENKSIEIINVHGKGFSLIVKD